MIGASFVARTTDGARVRVTAGEDGVRVLRGGASVAEGWPEVEAGEWEIDGVRFRAEGAAKTTELTWHQIGDGPQVDGGTLVADRAEARVGPALMLFPTSTRVRSNVRSLSGFAPDGAPVTWLVSGKFSGCGCSGG